MIDLKLIHGGFISLNMLDKKLKIVDIKSIIINNIQQYLLVEANEKLSKKDIEKSLNNVYEQYSYVNKKYTPDLRSILMHTIELIACNHDFHLKMLYN